MSFEEAAKSWLGWEGIYNRILVAHFITIKCMVSVIVVRATVQPSG